MQLFYWNQMAEEVLNPLMSRKMVHGESVTVAKLVIRKGMIVPLHQHVNEQVSLIESGALRFLVGGEEVIVRAGGVLVIPPNVPHSAEAIEDMTGTDIFIPVREDWRSGDDAYLRK